MIPVRGYAARSATLPLRPFDFERRNLRPKDITTYSPRRRENENADLHFDFIIDTVSATHDFDFYLGLLRTNGVMICVGLPSGEEQLSPFNLVLGRRSIAGSLIGGLPKTQEMLNYCGRHNITSDVEVIPIHQVNQAYDRMVKSDVRYRFVIDLASVK
jgi:alcohol dehydrogenase (NADP+)